MKKQKRSLRNQNALNFKLFIRNEAKVNRLVLGKALTPKTYYPENADKKAVIKNIK